MTVIRIDDKAAGFNRTHKKRDRRHPLVVDDYRGERRASEVWIDGPCKIIYRAPDHTGGGGIEIRTGDGAEVTIV